MSSPPPAESGVPFGIDQISVTPIRSSGSTYTSYTLVSAQDPEFAARVKALVDETQVNDLVSLREYIALSLAKDETRLAEIHAASCGEGPLLWRISLWVGSSKNVHQFWLHGLSYSGRRLDELIEAAKERGVQHTNSPAIHPGRRGPPGPEFPPSPRKE